MKKITGLQCYKSACWGDECFGFLERRDRLVDRCPSDARGKLQIGICNLWHFPFLTVFSFPRLSPQFRNDTTWSKFGQPYFKMGRLCSKRAAHSSGKYVFWNVYNKLWKLIKPSIDYLARSCWVPSQTKGGVVPKGELEKCYPTTMNQWLPFEGRMVIVNSLECLCSGNLCNDKIMSRSSSPSRNQLLGRVTIATTLTVAITHSLLYVFLI